MEKNEKQKQTNKKTHPYLVLASVRVTFQDLRGKKWLLGFCLFFENDWT